MLAFLLGFLLLPPTYALAQDLKLEELGEKSYGSLYFHGTSCRLYTCRFPSLYQAHHARVALTADTLTLHFEQQGRAIFPAISVPRAALAYYRQEVTAPHEGYEIERWPGERTLLKREKAQNGYSFAYYLQPLIGMRLIKFKQNKDDEVFSLGVELSYGYRIHRLYLDPAGKTVSETVDYSGIREIENQYLLGHAPDGPGV